MDKQRRTVEDEWFDAISACYGYEVPMEAWSVVDKLVAKGRVKWVSLPRGPGRRFKRAEPVV